MLLKTPAIVICLSALAASASPVGREANRVPANVGAPSHARGDVNVVNRQTPQEIGAQICRIYGKTPCGSVCLKGVTCCSHDNGGGEFIQHASGLTRSLVREGHVQARQWVVVCFLVVRLCTCSDVKIVC